MKQNLTMLVAILDKSGSMKPVQDDTIGGFNTFLEEQKKVPGEATMTLVQFSDISHTHYLDVPLLHVAPLTRETYSPSGWTSLQDALGKTINEIGQRLANKPEDEKPSKIIVMVMTDGAENKSKDFAGAQGLAKVKEMITHQKDKYSWEFVFVGANIDAFSTASSYGIDASFAIAYDNNKIGQQNVFKSLSRGTAASRMVSFTGGTLGNYFENDANLRSINSAALDTMDIANTIDKYKAVPTAPLEETKSDVK